MKRRELFQYFQFDFEMSSETENLDHSLRNISAYVTNSDFKNAERRVPKTCVFDPVSSVTNAHSVEPAAASARNARGSRKRASCSSIDKMISGSSPYSTLIRDGIPFGLSSG